MKKDIANIQIPEAPVFEKPFGPRITEKPPAGEYAGVVVDIAVELGAERVNNFKGGVTEKKDLFKLILGVKDDDGNLYLIDTYEQKLSGNERSWCFKWGCILLNTDNPSKHTLGDLVGRTCMVHVEEGVSNNTGKTYVKVGSLGPMLKKYKDDVVPVKDFKPLLDAAEAAQEELAAEDRADTDVPY